MSTPYRIETDDPGCPTCQHDKTFIVIGPDEVGSSTSYGDQEDAEDLRDACNRAYFLGRTSGNFSPLWKPFEEESLPADGAGMIPVWDSEFRRMSFTYWTSAADSLTHVRAMNFSHWLPQDAVPGPVVPFAEQVVPTLEPAPEASAPAVEPCVIGSRPSNVIEDYDDNIPF